ncbi:hypothetical protein N9595_05100 [Bacteroidia bacterium]|nr:hypothetical protein [Bacteroidia bacterium]
MLFSLALVIGYWFILDFGSTSLLLKLGLLLVEGLLLNYFCLRYSILGLESNMPLVLFSILSVLIVPDLSYSDLIYGIIWLAAVFLAFECRENPNASTNYMIYFGVLLGVAQTINHISVLLIIPVFILFLQTGTRGPRSFILSGVYFLMIVFSYAGVVYVMGIQHKIWELIPRLSIDYTAFNTIITKLFFPFILLSIAIHILLVNSYKFRFPNKSKNLNYTMLIQLIIALILLAITSEINLFIYVILASSILLSFGFVYKKSSTFANAAFASLVCISLCSLYLYKILIL